MQKAINRTSTYRVGIKQSNHSNRFLWARLQLDRLARSHVLTNLLVYEMLESLPLDLDSTYSRILGDIDSHLVTTAARALAWVVFASRSLYIEELIDACAIDWDAIPITKIAAEDSEYYLENHRLSASNILKLLQDLVTVHPPLKAGTRVVPSRTHSIALIHASVGDFLKNSIPDKTESRMKAFILRETEANSLIANTSLAYLYRYNTPSRRLDHYPLRYYAYWNWEKHIKDPEHIERVPETLVRRKALHLYEKLLEHLARPQSASLARGPGLDDGMPAPMYHKKLAKAFQDNSFSFPSAEYLAALANALSSPLFYPDYKEFFPDRSILRPAAAALIPYQYEPLDVSRAEVRLLDIFPSLDPRSHVRCRLSRASLDQNAEYVALSYSWGSLEETGGVKQVGLPHDSTKA